MARVFKLDRGPSFFLTFFVDMLLYKCKGSKELRAMNALNISSFFLIGSPTTTRPTISVDVVPHVLRCTRVAPASRSMEINPCAGSRV